MSVSRPAAVIILAAGEGTRMKSDTPKVLHEMCGNTLLGHVLATAREPDPVRLIVVVGHRRREVTEWLAQHAPDAQAVVQERQGGTGHAVRTVIEETGRDALAEMRRLLGVLRRDDEGPALAPQPTLARADSLVAQVEAEGLDTAITVEGEPVALSAGVDLAGYRVLQEALASARQARGVSHAEVSIVYDDANVLIKIHDDRKSSEDPDGDGMRALRERVSLYGGALRASPCQGGRGFEVEARLPIRGPR